MTYAAKKLLGAGVQPFMPLPDNFVLSLAAEGLSQGSLEKCLEIMYSLHQAVSVYSSLEVGAAFLFYLSNKFYYFFSSD